MKIKASMGQGGRGMKLDALRRRVDKRRTFHAALCVVAFLTCIGEMGAAPVLFYDFNTPGAVQASAGSDTLVMTTYVNNVATNEVVASPVGPDGGSILGFAGLNTTAKLQSGNLSGNPSFTTGLNAFTITAWVQNNTTAANERIFYLSGGSSVAIDFNLSGGSGSASQLLLNVNASGFVGSLAGGTGTPLSIPNSSSTWYFIAATYDQADGSVVFYSAPLGGTLASYAPTTKLTGAQVTNSTLLSIGNIPGGGRLLNANIDNVGFYNSALSSTDVNAVFASVPEPGTAGLLGLGFVAAAFAAARKHFRV